MAGSIKETYLNTKHLPYTPGTYKDTGDEKSHYKNCNNISTKENPNLRPAVKESQERYFNITRTFPETAARCTSIADQDFRTNTSALESRAREIDSFRGQIQALISKLREEITLLDETRKRIERSLVALQYPESINEECTYRRMLRTGHDNICDSVDCVLHQEKKLCSDVRDVMSLNLQEVESQMETNKVCKSQMEFDWSEKSHAYELEVNNIGLKVNGAIAHFPGATRIQNNQSTTEQWLQYTKELINEGKVVLNKSTALRIGTNDRLSKAASDLKTMADNVELALNDNISSTQLALENAERELAQIMSQISIAETLPGKGFKLSEQLDANLKIGQTRLFNRALRPGAENTRDSCQHGLINEVTHINEGSVRVGEQMKDVDATLHYLYDARAVLEDTIRVKRKSLYIDQQRCLTYRRTFPDAIILAGFM